MVKTMKKNRLSLNDVEWKKFKIKEIFKIKKVKGRPIENYDKGKIPYASTSSVNNAIINFIHTEENIINKGKSISIDPIAGKAFYHDYDFIGRGYSGASINVLYNNRLNKYSGLFLCKAIEKTSSNKASYGYLFNSKRLENGAILLPIDEKGNPNWQFMEDYIKQEQKEIAHKVISYYEQKMIETGFDLVGLGDVEWKNYLLEDIFRIESVKGKTISTYKEGCLPYVSTSSQNNGVSGFVDSDKNISSGKCISVDPIAGNCFYHEYEFVGRGGAGSAINLLYNDNLNKRNAQFILSSIEKVSKEKASYGIALNGQRLKATKIILPADKNGNPHWEYMSKFMQKLEAEKLEKALEYIYIYRLAISYESKLIPLDKKEWKEFWLEDVVDIKSGKDIYARERIEGNTPYITATAQNNGIGYFVDNINNTLEEKAISVNRNGSVGYAFYHEYKALYGNDTRQLVPRHQSKYISLFLTNVITKQKEKYGYGYKMGTGRLKRQKILLPINGSVDLDFDYIEKYMQIEEIKEQHKILDYYYKLYN